MVQDGSAHDIPVQNHIKNFYFEAFEFWLQQIPFITGNKKAQQYKYILKAL